jgi:hypothetical protein
MARLHRLQYHTTPLPGSTCHVEYGQPVLWVLHLVWDLTVPLYEFKGLQNANQEFRDLPDLSGQAQASMLYEDVEVSLPLWIDLYTALYIGQDDARMIAAMHIGIHARTDVHQLLLTTCNRLLKLPLYSPAFIYDF